MTVVGEAVRRQALHPVSELPSPAGFQKVETERLFACLHPLPIPQVIEPRNLGPDEVADAIEEARSLVRGHGRTVLVWLVGPDSGWLGAKLVDHGLVNEDAPGLESVEHAMALVEPLA